MVAFADLGMIPVYCGVHFASEGEALASPRGRMLLGFCPKCAYVRNLAFDPELLVYDATMDTNLHHSPAFRAFTSELVDDLARRHRLKGKRVVDIGCGQGEFLRELCEHAGCSGVGYDAMYAGPTGTQGALTFNARVAPRGRGLPRFDLVTSRHWFEHIEDPHEFLVDLRKHGGDRVVAGYLEVPNAGYDLSTAGWEVIYPHVSYFDGYGLNRVVERAGWRVLRSGTLFSEMFRFAEMTTARPADDDVTNPGSVDVERQLAAIEAFPARHLQERARWRATIHEHEVSGARPVLWGAGSRGVQLLNLADPDRRLAAVVDANPRKWGRYLPGTGHRVDAPAILASVRPKTVIITNPAYRSEIAEAMRNLGLGVEMLIA